MSVIFNSLKEKQKTASMNKKKLNQFKDKQRRYFFNNQLFLPKSILILSVAIFIVGFSLVFTVQYLVHHFQKKQTSSISPARSHPIKPESLSQVSVTRPIPALPIEEEIPDYNPGRYLPSQPEDKISALANQDHTAIKREPLHTEKPPLVIPNQIRESGSSILSGLNATDKPPESLNTNTQIQSDPDTLKEANESNTDIKNIKAVEKSAEEKILLANAQKSSDISRLVMKIQRSINQNDNELTPQLIETLESLKGKESSYVLKIKAFWYIRKGDYASARSSLATVLQKNENDIEAGINMAIIDIKTAHFQDARLRLVKLKEANPYNTQISELMSKLNF